MGRRGTFDYILLETTGLADPGNIAPLFWVDDGLGSSIYLDGIATLVDAKNILQLLEEPAPQEVQERRNECALTTAHLQISHADVILLNKTDLVSPTELDSVKQRIVSINSLATLHVTDHSKIPHIEGTVLDLHAYDKLTSVDFHEKGHSKLDPVSRYSPYNTCCRDLSHIKISTSAKLISTISFTFPAIPEEKVPQVDAWLRAILWDRQRPSSDSATKPLDFEIHRVKGILRLTDSNVRVIQGVREVFEITDAETRQPPSDAPASKMVLIGRGLGKGSAPWQESLIEFLGNTVSATLRK